MGEKIAWHLVVVIISDFYSVSYSKYILDLEYQQLFFYIEQLQIG